MFREDIMIYEFQHLRKKFNWVNYPCKKTDFLSPKLPKISFRPPCCNMLRHKAIPKKTSSILCEILITEREKCHLSLFSYFFRFLAWRHLSEWSCYWWKFSIQNNQKNAGRKLKKLFPFRDDKYIMIFILYCYHLVSINIILWRFGQLSFSFRCTSETGGWFYCVYLKVFLRFLRTMFFEK